METGKIKCADQELIVRAQSGDQRAFEALVRRHYQSAYALAFFWIGNRETALDISQEAFVRIYRNIHRFDAEKSLVAWMYVIAKNLCKNDLTRRRRRWLVFSDFFGRDGRTAENRENDWPAVRRPHRWKMTSAGRCCGRRCTNCRNRTGKSLC